MLETVKYSAVQSSGMVVSLSGPYSSRFIQSGNDLQYSASLDGEDLKVSSTSYIKLSSTFNYEGKPIQVTNALFTGGRAVA